MLHCSKSREGPIPDQCHWMLPYRPPESWCAIPPVSRCSGSAARIGIGGPWTGPTADSQQGHDQNLIGPESRTPDGQSVKSKKEENAMNSRLLYGTIALAFACGAGTGTAQIALDAAQKAAIITAVRDVRIAPPGHSFNISVGAQVPPSIELNYLPASALSQAPEARALKYTLVQNQVVLVDPTNMRIVDVIRLGQ